MTRVIRSRRAGLSRDESRQQPLYARLLGLQYLTPSGFLCFVFLEGAIALGVLLALAELVSWWGVLVLPVTVAAMVKLNDVVAGALSNPATPAVRPARASRTASRTAAAAQSAGARSAADQPAAIQSAGTPQRVSTLPPPVADFRAADVASPLDELLGGAAELRLPAPSGTGAHATTVRPGTMGHPAQDSWTGGQWTPETPSGGPSGIGGTSDWAPAWSPESTVATTRTRESMHVRGATDAGALNGPPATRPWASRAEPLDDAEQRARQAASRRYE